MSAGNNQDQTAMSADNILLIPSLSKELNLIGLPTLPYSLKKGGKRKSSSKCKEEALEIVFDSRLMIDTLTSICFELVKQIKRLGEDESNTSDKLNFANLRLQKQLQMNKLEMEKIVTELTNAKKATQQLKEKADDLQKKLKQCKVQEQTTASRNQTNENILKHNLKKKESDVFELYKVIWRQFNMADHNYLPENFELTHLNQPDFRKLWSEVRYSDTTTREGVLKKAVYVFQNNNTALKEENFLLKTSFLNILEELQNIFKLMIDKLHLPNSVLVSFKIQEVFEDVERFNTSLYTSILKKHLKVIRKVCKLFDKASFTVSDELFVCWSSIIKSL